ncbi:MAG: transketolase [Atopobiaceae bacterium]|nr:transketolase [Atopobiaceae bacterium]
MDSRELARLMRLDIVEVAHSDHSTHVGGSLSVADILAVLYADVMAHDPEHPDALNRDRLVMSKGHSSTALYSCLAHSGYITRDEALSQYEDGTRISGHVSHKVPGIEVSTGALGHGLPIACGMAYAAKLDGRKHRVFCILGDGELQEGTSWEASMCAERHGLANLTVIVDNNTIQSDASIDEVLGMRDVAGLLSPFGYELREVDGHVHDALRNALRPAETGAPVCVVAHTVKGKGASFAEGRQAFHSAKLNDAQYAQAIRELEACDEG